MKMLELLALKESIHSKDDDNIRTQDKRGYSVEFKDNFSYFSMKTCCDPALIERQF